MLKGAIFFTLLLLIYLTPCYSQISSVSVKLKDKTTEVPFDSTKNYMGEYVHQYIGQELYVKGKRKEWQASAYEGFCLNYNESVYLRENTYKPEVPSDLERALIESVKIINEVNAKVGIPARNVESSGISCYDSLVGKYFKVLDAIKLPNDEKYFLKLQEKFSGNVVYFKYDADSEYSFPFIIVGYFEKLKKNLVGKKFVFANEYLKDEIDIKTGKELAITVGEKWICTTVSVEELNYNLSAIMKDSRGQIMTVNVDFLSGTNKLNSIYSARDADKYFSKFGLTTWNMVLNGKVKIGWTKELCRLSWGEPNDINSTLTSRTKHEQWVYSGRYLYFENDILTTIQ